MIVIMIMCVSMIMNMSLYVITFSSLKFFVPIVMRVSLVTVKKVMMLVNMVVVFTHSDISLKLFVCLCSL